MPGPTAATRSEIDGQRFEIDGVRFVSSMLKRSTDDALAICKNPEHVDRYRELLDGFDRPNIVELGILQGGGVAMLALVAHPEVLVAIDLDQGPVPALTSFLEQRALQESVRLHFGVDQADRRHLTSIVDAAFGPGAQIDVVVDDASHVYGPTRTSFEILFPRLREGGVYLIEDWQVDHTFADGVARILDDPSHPQHSAVAEAHAASVAPGAPPRRPLTRMAMELVLAMSSPTPVVDDVTFTENWILVRRGPAPLDPEGMRLEDLYTDPLGVLGP